MQNARLNDSLAGIKMAGRNINNLVYADDTTKMAESEEELKSLLMRVREEIYKASLKLNMKETNVTASSPITSWKIEVGKVEAGTGCLFSSTAIQKHQFFGTLPSLWSSCHIHT